MEQSFFFARHCHMPPLDFTFFSSILVAVIFQSRLKISRRKCSVCSSVNQVKRLERNCPLLTRIIEDPCPVFDSAIGSTLIGWCSKLLNPIPTLNPLNSNKFRQWQQNSNSLHSSEQLCSSQFC